MLNHYEKYHKHEYHQFRECKNCHVPATCKIGCQVLPSILSSAAPTRELAASLRSEKITHWAKIEVAREEYLKVRGIHSYFAVNINEWMYRDMISGKSNNPNRTRRLRMIIYWQAVTRRRNKGVHPEARAKWGAIGRGRYPQLAYDIVQQHLRKYLEFNEGYKRPEWWDNRQDPQYHGVVVLK